VALGRPRLHLRATTSTNDRARELAQAGAPHGTLVTAGEQSAGRGRQGRVWSAPPGRALLLSLVLRDPPPLLPLAAALAVAEVAGADARIKWPNDVLVDERKVAGILAEARPGDGTQSPSATGTGWAVLGIGLNVAVRIEDLPPELHASAGTLGLTPGDLEPTLAPPTRRRCCRPIAPATRCSAARSHGPLDGGGPPASTARGGWWSSSPAAGAPHWPPARCTCGGERRTAPDWGAAAAEWAELWAD